MPRSKLGLNLPVEKILQKKQCNPVALLAELVMEKDPDGNWVLTGKDRMTALVRLAEFQRPKPKPVEQVVDSKRDIKIVRQNFSITAPGPDPKTQIISISPDGDTNNNSAA